MTKWLARTIQRAFGFMLGSLHKIQPGYPGDILVYRNGGYDWVRLGEEKDFE